MRNTHWALLFVMSTTAPLSAQVREQRGLPPVSQPAAGPSGSAPSASGIGNSLTTEMTSAPVELGPGDLLEVAVFDTAELTQKIRVNSESKIVLTLIGEISVTGMTTDALQALIRTRLIDGHFLRNPQVSVFVVEFAGQTVSMTGEVNRPGVYPLMRSHHLQDMIAVAGGLSPRAGNLVTINHSGSGALPMLIDLGDNNLTRRDPEISSGDSISVGETGIVYVLGDVSKPGGFLLDRRGTLSVVQAVALAEGTVPSASIRKAELIRNSDGRHIEIPIDLKAILHSESPDVSMQAGDILYFPTSLLRGLGRSSLQTILATASGVAIYSSSLR